MEEDAYDNEMEKKIRYYADTCYGFSRYAGDNG